MEKDYLNGTYGKPSPFRVPDGYYDSFSSRIMERIEAMPERKALRLRLRPVWYAAAMIAAIAIVVSVAKISFSGPDKLAEEDGYMDQMLTYGVFDDQIVDDFISSNYDE